MRNIRNVSVCVVGGAGFLGSHLVDHLIEERDCDVVVLDNLVAGRLEFIHPRAKFVHHDITGPEGMLLDVFRHYRVRFVLNYAAYPYVPDSFERPLLVFNVNAFGAMKVIHAAHEAGCEAILQVSSAELYGQGQNGRIECEPGRGFEPKLNEDALVLPHSSYGAAKAAIDAMVQVRWREAKVPVIALRQFNCCGERETHPYVVPEIISQIAKHACLRCEGDGKAHGADRPFEWIGPGSYPGPCPVCKGITTVRLGNNSFRDFLYAGDAVRMAVELLEKGHFGEVYNLGSEAGVKIYDLAKLIGKVMGFADVTVEEDENRKRPWEIWHLQSDNSKINSVLKECGHAKCANDLKLTPLEEALRRTIKWYEGNGRKWPWER